jgi:hypothetical protein
MGIEEVQAKGKDNIFNKIAQNIPNLEKQKVIQAKEFSEH